MPNAKLIAAVVHEHLGGGLFEDWAGLSDAVKARCATLRIAYDSGSITDAVKLVERSRPVFVTARCAIAHPRHLERVDDARPLSRDEAKDLYARLVTAVRREHLKGRARA